MCFRNCRMRNTWLLHLNWFNQILPFMKRILAIALRNRPKISVINKIDVFQLSFFHSFETVC